jgi:hypothetical protein
MMLVDQVLLEEEGSQHSVTRDQIRETFLHLTDPLVAKAIWTDATHTAIVVTTSQRPNRDASRLGPAGAANTSLLLETVVRGYGGVDVMRDWRALFRTTRIFADLTVMQDALRAVIQLDRTATGPCFIRKSQNRRRVSHVAIVRTRDELRRILPFLREGFRPVGERGDT